MENDLETELESIIAAEALRAGFTAEQLRSRAMSTPYVKARRRIAKIARCEGFSYPQIGRALNRDHSTIISLVCGRRP